MKIKLSQQKFSIDDTNCCKLYYQLVLKKYLNSLNYKGVTESTIRHSKSEINRFTNYLRKNNINRLSKITNEKILNYISLLHRYSSGTRSLKVSKIRTFLRFSYINSYTPFDFSLIVPKVKINHNSIVNRTVFTPVEVNKMLKSIDISSPTGKRDYAILILISHLGLRFSDIKKLKFENINWQMNVINISQSKTQKYLSLPLTNDIGNAIIDYIKNGRPNVDSKYIFLSNNEKPFSPKESISYSFKKYLQLAGIDISDKKYIGSYTLRHSLATTLLQKRTSLSTISSILGHTDINNTAIYLKVDIPSLRQCCLNLEV